MRIVYSALFIKFLVISVSMFSIMSLYPPLIIFHLFFATLPNSKSSCILSIIHSCFHPHTFYLLSSCDNWTYNTMAFIWSRFSLQNHGKSIHLKSTWLFSSRLRKWMSSIIPFKETNRRGILFLRQKNNAFCSSTYAMARSSLQLESFLLSKKDNWTFNESCR